MGVGVIQLLTFCSSFDMNKLIPRVPRGCHDKSVEVTRHVHSLRVLAGISPQFFTCTVTQSEHQLFE
jgi:hypothetical protein